MLVLEELKIDATTHSAYQVLLEHAGIFTGYASIQSTVAGDPSLSLLNKSRRHENLFLAPLMKL